MQNSARWSRNWECTSWEWPRTRTGRGEPREPAHSWPKHTLARWRPRKWWHRWQWSKGNSQCPTCTWRPSRTRAWLWRWTGDSWPRWLAPRSGTWRNSPGRKTWRKWRTLHGGDFWRSLSWFDRPSALPFDSGGDWWPKFRIHMDQCQFWGCSVEWRCWVRWHMTLNWPIHLIKPNQSINQSIEQSINQSINQSIHRTINQSIARSIDRIGSINQSIARSIDRIGSINQSIYRKSSVMKRSMKE